MGKLIERYNKVYEDHAVTLSATQVSAQIHDKYYRYRESLKNKQPIECRFQMADSNGNLMLKDENGVRVVLEKEQFQKDASYYDEKVKDRFIGLSLTVKVKAIDEAQGVVEVAGNVDREMIKGALLKEIYSELRQGHTIDLWGDITKVYPGRVLVNILHRNILGFIDVHNWQNGYTRNLFSVAKIGEPVKIRITASAPRLKGKDYAFICDRRPFAPDPWERLDDFEIGSSLVIKCIERPTGKKFWWGVSEFAPGIEVMCDYNDKLKIMNGCSYKCKIFEFSKKDHILKVVPFELYSAGLGTTENVEFLTTKSKKKGG